MSDIKYSPRQAAQAVLKKVHDLLKESELSKSENLHKYETEMKRAPSKPPKDPSKATERDYEDYEVKSGKSKSSNGKRQAKQINPTDNPKEFEEGNNKPDGMEPYYEFKDKVPAELAKEKKAHEMDKAENPDKEADAELGEKVEKDVEQHFEENKEAEKKEGHKLMTKCDKCGNMHKSEQFAELCGDLGNLKEEFEGLNKSELEKSFDSLVHHLMSEKGGGYSKDSAEKIAGHVNAKYVHHYKKSEEIEKAEKHQKLANKVEHGKENLKEALKEANHPKKVLSDLRDSKLDKHALSPEQIKSKMKKGEMEKHGLSPEQIKAKMKKGESKHDRCVEDVKESSPEVKNPDAVCVAEGVKPAKWNKGGEQPESVFVPAKLIGSAKLSKFMERLHAKRKAKAMGTPDEHAGEQHEHSQERAIEQMSEQQSHGGEGHPKEDWEGNVK